MSSPPRNAGFQTLPILFCFELPPPNRAFCSREIATTENWFLSTEPQPEWFTFEWFHQLSILCTPS
jgi:hypothetical protein